LRHSEDCLRDTEEHFLPTEDQLRALFFVQMPDIDSFIEKISFLTAKLILLIAENYFLLLLVFFSWKKLF